MRASPDCVSLGLARYLTGLCVWLALSCGQAHAQSDASDASVESIRATIADIEANTDLDEALRTKVLGYYQEAEEFLLSEASAMAARARFERERGDAPADIAAARAAVAEESDPPRVDLPEDAEVIEYESGVSAARARLEQLRRDRKLLEEGPQDRAEQAAQLPLDISRSRGELAETESAIELARVRASELSELEMGGLLASLEAQRRSLVAKIERDEEHLLFLEMSADLPALERERIELEIAAAEAQLEAWQTATEERLRRATEVAEGTAEEAVRRVGEVHPLLRGEAQRAADLAQRLSAMTRADELLTRDKTEVAELTSKIKEAIDTAIFREKQIGLSNAIGIYLRREKANLPQVREFQRREGLRDEQLAASYLDLDAVAEARLRLENESELLEEWVERLPGGSESPDAEALREQARAIIQRERDRIRELEAGLEKQPERIINVQDLERALIEQIEVYTVYIDQRVLWIRSSPPVWGVDFGTVSAAFAWLVDPSNWGDFWSATRRSIARRPIRFSLMAAVLIVALLNRRSFGRALAERGGAARKRSCTSIEPTIHAVLLSAGIAIAIPGLLGLLNWRVSQGSGVSSFSKAILGGLRTAAWVILLVQGLRVVWRPAGLGPAHFGWRSDRGRVLRRALWALLGVALPSAAIAAVFASQENEEWNDSLGRIALIIALISLTVFLWRYRPTDVRRSDGIGARVGRLFTFVVVLVPASLAALAISGYYFTAVVLADRLLITIGLIFGCVLIHGLGSRWLLIVRRRLAIEQARERRRAALEDSGQSETEVPLEVEAVDLDAVDSQSRQMLRSAVAVGFLIGAWAIWVDVLPALGQLDEINLWTYLDDASDKSSTVPVTLRSLIVAVVILFGTFLVRRNLAGVLEVTFLRRLAIGAGERYAFTALVGYVVTLVGIVWAFAALGVGWEKVQWLVAAVSVGLGFGLQEIFANFISGLIILAERPIRVGDWVSVGEIDGKVTRILMRATTIMDRDRKELIVPNRAFVTGQLINWTLSDPVTRVILPVGVAYGTDTDKATEVLLEVAQSHRDVLSDPAPSVIFRSFDDSALGIELRVFINDRDQYPAILHPLNTAIHERFMEEGIEIAFPQRDLHIKSSVRVEPNPAPSGVAENAKSSGR